jgi:hypothetical protein
MPNDEEVQMSNPDFVVPVIALSDVVEPVPEATAFSSVRTISPDPTVPSAADHLVRRLRLVLRDLCLEGVVPSDWVAATSDGVAFATLDLRRADRFTRVLEDLLEDLAAAHEAPAAIPVYEQLQLFEVTL